jgi:uncharacterized protein (DUF362 family)
MSVSIIETKTYNRDEIKDSLKLGFKHMGMNPNNPFENLITPGDSVFIKPNWVAHEYRKSCPVVYDVYTTITHPNVIKEVTKFVDQALQGNGKIIIGDNPSIDADFDKLMQLQNLDSLYSEIETELQILDLRPLVCADLNNYGIQSKMKQQQGDTLSDTTINLRDESYFHGMNSKRFRGVFNNRTDTVKAHSNGDHLYSISNSIFKSDVYISIPKLKTHHKTGVTLNMKGLVGIASQKNQLVHWREGFPLINGDAYPNFLKWFTDKFRKIKKRGAWPGNDTIWRMVNDLYLCVRKVPRKYFSVIDGILAGEGNGPFCPEPKHAHVLIMGNDLVTTDIMAVHFMGFNMRKIKYLADKIPSAIVYYSNAKFSQFKPPNNWKCLLEK